MGTPDLKKFHPFTTDADGESWVKYSQVEAELRKARTEALKEAAMAACMRCRLGAELHVKDEFYYHGPEEFSLSSRCESNFIHSLISKV
jgi:hypothetical protein